MKIHLATASSEDLQWATDSGLADGALVSTSMIDARYPGDDVRTRALACTRIVSGPVYVSTGGRDAAALYQDARELSRASDQLVLEMPLDLDTLEALHRAASDGSRVAASMVFTAAQALLAAKAGASAVLVPVTALEAQGLGVASTLADIRAIYDRHLIECELIAVCPLSAALVGACALAGVDAVVLDPSTLRDLVLHPLTDRTLDAMLPDLIARARSRAAV